MRRYDYSDREIAMIIGSSMRVARRTKKLTPEELAPALGLTLQELLDYEDGAPVPVEVIEKYPVVLGISIDAYYEYRRSSTDEPPSGRSLN